VRYEIDRDSRCVEAQEEAVGRFYYPRVGKYRPLCCVQRIADDPEGA